MSSLGSWRSELFHTGSSDGTGENEVRSLEGYDPNDLVSSWMIDPPVVPNEGGTKEREIYSFPTKRCTKKRVIAIGSLILIIGIAAATVATVMIVNDSSSSSKDAATVPTPTSPPTPPPTFVTPEPTPSPLVSASPRPTFLAEGQLGEFLSSVSFDSGMALSDNTSPQYSSLSWLSADPKVFEYSDKQKIQRFVLATMYYSTGGDQWGNNNGWLSYDDNECSWQFDETDACGPNGEIINLGLASNQLSGTMPQELGLLSDSLVNLNVQNNNISGSIPSDMMRLTALELLNLRENQVSGFIPTEIGLMLNLTRYVYNVIIAIVFLIIL